MTATKSKIERTKKAPGKVTSKSLSLSEQASKKTTAPSKKAPGKKVAPAKAKKNAATVRAARKLAKSSAATANTPPHQSLATAIANFGAGGHILSASTRTKSIRAQIAAIEEEISASVSQSNEPAITPLYKQSQLSQLGTQLSAVRTAGELSDLRSVEVALPPALDPRLQLALVNRRMGKQVLRLSSTSGEELPVVARVTDPDEWAAISDVFSGGVIGKLEQSEYIVTGRVPIGRIEFVRDNPIVKSLKASQPIIPSLGKTTQTMGVAKGMLKPGAKDNKGKGVVVGIVDFGGDFAHPNFRDRQGNSRLLALWNQADTARAGQSVRYGRCYTKAEINRALGSSDPYKALNYHPGRASHGTHVMDIAGGNGLGTGVAGVAPEADLVFVEAAASDIPWEGPDAALHQFGDSVQMLEAIRFIFDEAGDRPCVVNLSLGTNGGPHDGSSLVEKGIDAIVRERPNSAVVIAASNSQLDGIHISGNVPKDRAVAIEFEITERGGGELELWYEGPCELEATLVAPDGSSLLTVGPNASNALQSQGQVAIFASNRLDDPNNHDNVVSIWIAPGMPGGKWQVQLLATNAQETDYHAWLERLDHAQPCFINPVDTHTLGSISTGFESIVVGSYDANSPSFSLSGFSSCGPTRDGRQKPEVSAPGHNVYAASSTSPDGLARMSGTSMAAPAITGLVALMLSEAKRKGVSLASSQIRTQLQTNTDGAPPAPGAWDPRYGHGRGSGKAV